MFRLRGGHGAQLRPSFSTADVVFGERPNRVTPDHPHGLKLAQAIRNYCLLPYSIWFRLKAALGIRVNYPGLWFSFAGDRNPIVFHKGSLGLFEFDDGDVVVDQRVQ